MKSIRDIDVDGKRVLVRVDFNVPYDEHQNITDDTRIRAVLPTIQYLLDRNAILILCSHMARPGGKVVPELSLLPVARRLSRILKHSVPMAHDCVGPDIQRIVSAMKPCDIILLENLRFHPEEEQNDDAFAKELADLCDVYINDAFAVAHRANASVSAIIRHTPVAAAGFLLIKELTYFSKAMSDPHRPLVAIIGGAKVSGKLEAIENMINHVDKLIIGGAMANTFLQSTGIDMGKSKVEPDLFDTAQNIIKKAMRKKIKFYLPVDAVAADRFDARAEIKVVPVQEIPAGWMAMDIGPSTSLLYSEALYDAKTIIWNGPMGVFEMDAFSRGTGAMVQSVANSYALTIVGGGDTDVAVHKAGESHRMTYISTGGGAFLTLMEGKMLPAVKALNAAAERMESGN